LNGEKNNGGSGKKRRTLFSWMYDREGKGVKKSDVIKNYNFKNFFKLFGRKWGDIIRINLLYIVGNFPIFFFILAVSGNFSRQAMKPISEFYPLIYGMGTAGDSAVTLPLSGIHGLFESFPVDLVIDNIGVKILYGLSLLLLATFGLVNASCTYIMRNTVKCEPIFWSVDFFGTIKKNWKIAVPMGIFDALVLFLNVYAIYFYWLNYNTLYVMFFCSLVTLMVYMFMRFYMYLIMVTFDMGFFKILKNSFIFAILCMGKNFIALIGIALVVFLALVFASVYTPLGVIILLVLLFGLCTFISTYVAYPQMKKFMIDPYYNDTEPEPEDDGDNYYDDEPKLGKKGGYGADDGEYYDGGEYKTDENEYKPDEYKKNN
jgi:uncharacterized membrane protein YesL